jgi:hypothetical protein
MALKLRRGTDAQRIVVTPEEGELVYTIDTKKLYVGDGSTVGGVAVDTGGSGITDIVQDTSPQLGGNLDLNGYNIYTTSQNINIDPGGNGRILLGKSILGNVTITRDEYSSAAGSGFSFNQFHTTADAVNFAWVRGRGNTFNPSAVIPGDDIADLVFAGVNSANGVTGVAVINCQVTGQPLTNQIPGALTFQVNNGAGLQTIAKMDDFFRVSNIKAVTGNNINVATDNIISIGNIQLSQDGLSTANSNANLYITANSSGRIYLDNMAWPNSDGLSGQVLTTNGSGSLSWSTVSGGGGSFSRTNVSGSSTAIANGASASFDITGAAKGYIIYKIQVNEPAWVRIYTDSASRTADLTRAEGVDPSPGSGVIAEIITTSTSETVLITPGVFGFNNELTPVTEIPITVTNKGGYTTPITVTMTILALE